MSGQTVRMGKILSLNLPLIFDSLRQPSAEVIEIAKNFLKNGVDIKLIAKSTSLSESQIKNLKESK